MHLDSILIRVVSRLAALLEPIAPARGTMPLLGWRDWLYGEAELRVFSKLASSSRCVIDIGGAEGVYSYFAFAQGSTCFCFEANPESAARLLRRLPRVKTYNVALSNTSGVAELRVPVVRGNEYKGWGTIQGSNMLSELPTHSVVTRDVRMEALDSFGLSDVDLIKIDVEGHELAVLQGATGIIDKWRPHMLIEAENRHRAAALASIVEFLRPFDYQCWYMSRHASGTAQSITWNELTPGGADAEVGNNFFFFNSSRISKEKAVGRIVSLDRALPRPARTLDR